jgi:hypothetical protein
MLKDIYFFDSAKLAEMLGNGSVSDILALKHLIVVTIIFGTGYIIPVEMVIVGADYDYSGGLIYSVGDWVLNAIISYYGLWMIYQANAKGDNKDFFKRFTALSLPVTIRLIVIMLPALFFIMLLRIEISNIISAETEIFNEVFWIVVIQVFVIYFYVLMRNSMRIASGSNVVSIESDR